MNNTSFFAMLSRMKYINRWSLMRNTSDENLSEHSLEVAIIAHALAVIRNKRYGGSLNAERAALLAVFHDVPEILTGDLPTPVKYFNTQIQDAYKAVEKSACDELIARIPEDLQDEYKPLIISSDDDMELHMIVKAADKISALIKCIEERKAGNMEFVKAEKTTRQWLEKNELEEVKCFIDEFLPSYALTIDEF